MLAASTVFLAAAMPSDVTINVDTSAVTHQVDPMFMVRRFPIYSACWHARSCKITRGWMACMLSR